MYDIHALFLPWDLTKTLYPQALLCLNKVTSQHSARRHRGAVQAAALAELLEPNGTANQTFKLEKLDF